MRHLLARQTAFRSAALLIGLSLLAGCSAHKTDAEIHAALAGFDAAGVKKRPPFANREELAAFESTRPDAYVLGPGDEVTITVWGYPDLSGQQIVGPDGQVTLPIVGSLSLSGRTRGQASAEISKALEPFYRDAAATVRVDQYVSNQVLVLGRVTNPGAIRFEVMPTLLDAITRAGALPIGGVGADKAALTRCAIFRGRDQVMWVDLRGLLRAENLAANVALQRNDIVYIPDADDQLVYVMGQVNTPGAYQLTPDMSFLDLLAKAGGPTRDASPGKIQVVRPAEGMNTQVDLDDLLEGHGEFNFRLAEGDIVYVPENGVAQVGYVLEKLSPLTQLILFAAALGV